MSHGLPVQLPVRVIAIGSDHGDDQAGWRVIELLRHERLPGVDLVALSIPLDLLNHLQGCHALVVLDACSTGAAPGSTVRLTWPLAASDSSQHASSHGLSVGATLALAESLGMVLPPVTLLGVEVAACEPTAGLSLAVRDALPALCRLTLDEVRRYQEDDIQTAITACAENVYE